jgi:hypothetical protein
MKKKKSKNKIPRSMRKKFNEKRRLQRSINESQEKLLQRARERVGDNNFDFEISPKNTEKMSEIIAEYAAPLLDVAKNFEEQKKAVSLAISMWNLSLLPENKQPQYLKKIESVISSSTKGDEFTKEREEIFNYLINRKRKFYQDINRLVQDYEIFETPEGFHLNIASLAVNGQ